MKVLRNTLYVQTENTRLYKDGMNVVARLEESEVGRIPVHTLSSIVCFGNIYVTVPLMAYCAEVGVTIAYLNLYGKFQARVEGPITGNILLRKAQYRNAEDATKCLQMSGMFLIGKFHNQRSVVRRALRDHRSTLDAHAVNQLHDFDKRATESIHTIEEGGIDQLNDLRGLEGALARSYFSCFPPMIRAKGIAFRGRSRRPPLDPVNCLMSFLYSLLVRDICGGLEAFGLDNQAGFLHSDRPGRPSLALDMLEEFRPCFADRLALSLLNRKQLTVKDFKVRENGAVSLTEAARKKVLVSYQDKKQRELTHPFTGEKEKFGTMWLVQAQLLARSLRGDLDCYPPFLWK